MPSPDPADHYVMDALDSFYCHNWAVKADAEFEVTPVTAGPRRPA